MSAIPFARVCQLHGLPAPIAEYGFCARRWRFDFAWPVQLVALEVNGGVWTRGKHSRGAGQVKDFEKWTCAAALGWRVLHCQPKDLESSSTLDAIRLALTTMGRSGVKTVEVA